MNARRIETGVLAGVDWVEAELFSADCAEFGIEVVSCAAVFAVVECWVGLAGS